MRITARQLRQIIKEEVSKVLRESASAMSFVDELVSRAKEEAAGAGALGIDPLETIEAIKDELIRRRPEFSATLSDDRLSNEVESILGDCWTDLERDYDSFISRLQSGSDPKSSARAESDFRDQAEDAIGGAAALIEELSY